MKVNYTCATCVGGKVSATAVLRRIEGRRLLFGVAARDSGGTIGEGAYERVIVDSLRLWAM